MGKAFIYFNRCLPIMYLKPTAITLHPLSPFANFMSARQFSESSLSSQLPSVFLYAINKPQYAKSQCSSFFLNPAFSASSAAMRLEASRHGWQTMRAISAFVGFGPVQYLPQHAHV